MPRVSKNLYPGDNENNYKRIYRRYADRYVATYKNKYFTCTKMFYSLEDSKVWLDIYEEQLALQGDITVKIPSYPDGPYG